ncbi:MAG: hypothetical protein ACRDZU_10435, partial [Acidimicrobiales bacterium]
AWDIRPCQTVVPLPLGCIIGLESPGGTAPTLTHLDRADALRHLAAVSVWLDDPVRREAALFGVVARVSGAIPFALLQLPFSPSWLDGVPALLAGAVT